MVKETVGIWSIDWRGRGQILMGHEYGEAVGIYSVESAFGLEGSEERWLLDYKIYKI